MGEGPTWKLTLSGPRFETMRVSTLNLPISEGGTNSSHTHHLAKSQRYQGLKLLLNDTKFMTMINSMHIHHRFQEK